MSRTSDDYRRFVCVVAGDNPDRIIAKYDSKLKVEPYVLYWKKDARALRDHKLLMLSNVLKHPEGLSDLEKDSIKEDLDYYQTLSPDEYFEELGSGMDYDDDGNILTTTNPNGKWSYHNIGNTFSMPLVLFDGTKTHQAKKGEIDWTEIHLKGQDTYRVVWDMVIGGKKPEGATEQMLYENMHSYTDYLMKYGDKKTYVAANTSFWGYAFCSEKTGWKELEPNMEQFPWVINFYYNFIVPLPDDTLITIVECMR